MASKKVLKNWEGVELTETLFDTMETTTELQNELGTSVSADQVVERLASKGKTYTKKQVVASLARLDTTCGLLKKHEPIKVTTYSIKED